MFAPRKTKSVINLVVTILILLGLAWSASGEGSELKEAILPTGASGDSGSTGELPSQPAVYNDPGQTISVKVGQKFAIALEENPSTGYRWQQKFDNSFLELVADSFKPPTRALPGAPGTRVFEFKALKKGEAEITTVLKRAWEENVAEPKVFTVSIWSLPEPKMLSLDSVFTKADTLLFEGHEVSRSYDSQSEVWFATLRKEGKTLTTFSQGGRFKEWTNFGFFPFLGAKAPQLIVEQFSGGAHCCWFYWIFNAAGDLELFYASEKYPVGYGLTPVDLDTDGVFEFTQTILTFDYFDRLPHALSPLPAVVFKYDTKANQYRPANRDFPLYLLDGIEKDARRVEEFNDTINTKTYDDPHGEYLSAVLEVVLRYIYAGKEKEAWRFYETEYKLSDKEEMKTKIREKLESCSIYKYVYGR